MHRDLLRSLVLLVIVQALAGAAAPAPHPWRPNPRLAWGNAARRGEPVPDDVTNPTRVCRAVRAQLSTSPQPTRAPPPPRGPGEPVPADRRQRTRRGKRSRARGCRGGTRWRRPGQAGSRSSELMLVAQLNIQSLKPKLPDLRYDLHGDLDFDILALSETFLVSQVPSRLLNVDGYKLFRCDRPVNSRLARGHGGVAIYVREHYNCEQITSPVTGIESSNLEIIWLRVRACKFPPILFASVYRVPTNSRQLALDLEDFEHQLQHMMASYPRTTVIVAGDFNCCLLKNAENPSAHPLLSLLSTYGLHVVNKKYPTYRPANSLLDVIAISQTDLLLRAGVARCNYGGPHDFTRVALRCSGRSDRNCGTLVLRRCIGNVDTATFCQTLSAADWSPVLLADGPERKWSEFQRVFLKLLDRVAPLRRVRARSIAAPPVSVRTRQLMQRRRAALAGSDRDLYRQINKECRAAIRGDARAHFQREINKNNRTSLWRTLAPVIGSKNARAEAPNITPDALNNYYVTVGPETAASVPAPTAEVPVRLPRVTTGAFKVQPVDIDLLYATLRSMKPSSSTGNDGVSVVMFQNFSKALVTFS